MNKRPQYNELLLKRLFTLTLIYEWHVNNFHINEALFDESYGVLSLTKISPLYVETFNSYNEFSKSWDRRTEKVKHRGEIPLNILLL